jgi:hypothetical protein
MGLLKQKNFFAARGGLTTAAKSCVNELLAIDSPNVKMSINHGIRRYANREIAYYMVSQ